MNYYCKLLMGKTLYLVNHSKEIIHDLGSTYSFSGCKLTEIFNKFKWDFKDEIEIMDDQSLEFDILYKTYYSIDCDGNLSKEDSY